MEILTKTPAKIMITKTTGMKDNLKVLAKEGSTVFVYDMSRDDVWLCVNDKNVTFSCRKEHLKLLSI